MPFVPGLLHGTTVTFLQRQVTGTDQYGNDVYGSTSTDVPGCAIAPGSSNESFQGTLLITADVVVYAPAATMVDLPYDQFIYNDETYNVIGNPNNWVSPWTTTGSFEMIAGRLVTTGGDAT